jgi:hypothetical protein
MRGDNRAARRNRVDAFDDGGGVVAGVGHGVERRSLISPPLQGEGRSPKASRVGK